MRNLYELTERERVCRAFAFASVETWNDLRDDEHLGEPSITDYRLLLLRRMCPEEVKVIKFGTKRESQIGADWEWWFGCGNEWFGMRVQAKKLDREHLEYAHLDHHVLSSGQLQVDLLLKDAQERNLYAMYCFYNYWPDEKHEPNWRCKTFARRPELWGSSVADAHVIQNHVHQDSKTLQDIGKSCMPLMCLACCTGHAGPDASLPHRARSIASVLSPNHAQAVPPIIQHLPPYVIQVANGLTPDNQASVLNLDGILIVQENPDYEGD